MAIRSVAGRRARVWVGIAIAVVLAGGVTATSERFQAFRQRLAFQWRMRPLASAVAQREWRDVEPRLAGFPRRPFDPTRQPGPLAVLAAAAKLARDTDPRARALATLLAGNDEAAARLFDELSTRAPDPKTLADAAAAFYVNAVRRGKPERFSDALAASRRAVAAERGNAPAWFTRALTLQRLELREDAREAWQRYLELDRTSPWAAEAKAHLDRAKVAGPPRASALDEALSAPIAREVASHPELAAALSAYGQAVIAYNDGDLEDAERGLAIAVPVFEREASPARYAAKVQTAGCRYYANDFRGAIELARTSLAGTPDRYRTIRGKLLWLIGLSHAVLGEAQASMQAYQNAAIEFRAAHDLAGIAAIESLLAEECEYLGQPDAAAEHRRAALASAYESGHPRRIAMALSEAGSAAASRGEVELAAVVFERLAAQAKRTPNAYTTIDALTSYAGTLAASGRTDEARQAFREAATIVAAQKDAAVRRRMEATVALRYAKAGLGRDAAMPSLEAAIAAFEESGDRFLLSDALLARARTAARNDGAAAERDLRRGLALIDGELVDLSDPLARAGYLERRQEFFDELVPLLMHRGAIADAFEAADEAHHALLATYRTDAPRADAVDPKGIPAGTTIVAFFVARDDVYGWTVSREGVTGGRVAAAAPALRSRTRDLQDAIAARDRDATRRLLRELDALLLAPRLTRRPSQLVVIPDRFLAAIPFAALITAAGDYRVADTPIGMDVSARHHLGRNARPNAPNESVVIAADEALAEVRHEKTALQRLYPSAALSTGEGSGAELIDVIGRHTIAHIASHGFADRRRPLQSGLRVSEALTVTAQELAVARYPSTRLVFLGACSTNAASDRRTGVGNVAAALLAAGVPTTVGALWDVPDAAAREIAIGFHTALRAGHSPQEALRSAQLQLIGRAPDDVRAWGAYVVNGSPDG